MMILFQCFFYHSKGSVYHVLDDDGDDLATKLIMFHDVLGSKSYLQFYIYILILKYVRNLLNN
jgi:hypothetical protein